MDGVVVRLLLSLLPLSSIASDTTRFNVQLHVDVGFTYPLAASVRGGLSVGYYAAVVDASIRYTKDLLTTGLSAGYALEGRRYRVTPMAGAYYADGKWKFGGALHIQGGVGIAGAEWNGRNWWLFVGMALFNPKKPSHE